MSDSTERHRTPEKSFAEQAAAWVLRCDRGLSPGEQDAFSEWLARDPRHGAELARHRRHWNRLDSLAQWRPEHGARPNPDLLAPPLRTRFRRWASVTITLAAAASVAVALWIANGFGPVERAPGGTAPVPRTAATALPAGPRVLDDGTIVELNRGADITVQFAPAERRVRLDRGEAHFVVTKDEARPFIVNAGGIDVRAVGTAFNVRVDAAAVEVLVTEGRVQLDAAKARALDVGTASAAPVRPAKNGAGSRLALLEARQRAVVSLSGTAAPPQIATLTTGEIERVLAWQHRLLDFTAAPLTEIVAEFNRRNVVQLVLIDPELASVRISASFRSDNIDGFVRLLEAGFGARAERRGESEILLRKAR